MLNVISVSSFAFRNGCSFIGGRYLPKVIKDYSGEIIFMFNPKLTGNYFFQWIRYNFDSTEYFEKILLYKGKSYISIFLKIPQKIDKKFLLSFKQFALKANHLVNYFYKKNHTRRLKMNEQQSTLNRREKISLLNKQITSLSEEKKNQIAKKLGVVNIEGKYYSLHNQLLLSMQIDNPTVVAGFKQWQESKRKIKKGEHGALILFPVGSKDNNGLVEEPTNFLTATVFDISQTEEMN